MPQARFGLGTAEECDVVVTLSHHKGEIVRGNVKSNQVVMLKR